MTQDATPAEQPTPADDAVVEQETPAPAPAPAQDTPEAPQDTVVEDTGEAGGAKAKAAADATPTAGGWFWGTGRRKASVARVRVRAGKGTFQVNGRDLKEFFSQERDHNNIGAVLEATSTTGGLEVQVKVHGGGYTGQAGAIRLGLGRALMRYDGALEQTLRDHGFLTRDPRRVERKKPGQPGARKRFQFSKR